MKNGDTIVGVVLSENTKEMVLKTKLNDTLTIKLSSIEEIRALDDENFQDPLPPAENSNIKKDQQSQSTAYKKNLIAYNFLDLAFSNITASYERLFDGGYFGLKIPVSIGFSKDGTLPPPIKSKIMSVGLDLNGYFGGQGNVRCYLGPGLEIGKYLHQVANYSSFSNAEGPLIEISYFSACVNSGLMIQITQFITIYWQVGIGARWDRQPDFYNYTIPSDLNHRTWNIGFNLACRF